MSRDICLSQLVGCYWHLVHRGEGCCQISYNAHDSTTTKNYLVQTVSHAKDQKSWGRGQIGGLDPYEKGITVVQGRDDSGLNQDSDNGDGEE